MSSTAAKKYVLIRLPVGGPSTQQVMQKIGYGGVPAVAILDSDGKRMAGLGHSLPPQDVIQAIEGTPAHITGLEALEKAKGNPTAIVAALKQVAALPNKKAVEILTEHANNEEAPALVRKTAIDLFAKQKEAGKEVVPFLTHKNQTFRTSAATSLKQMGILAMPPLLEALESDEVEMRFAAYQVAAAITRNPKVSRDGPLWKAGKEEDRQKALDGWREWYEKNKPQVPK